jgi:hypothetical protein
MPVYTASYIIDWKPLGTWANIDDYVLNVTGDNTISANVRSPLAFGQAGELSFNVSVRRTLGVSTWAFVPIRVQFTRDATSVRHFHGVIVGYSGDLDTVEFTCRGYAELIKKRTRSAYSEALYRRPVFTKTTSVSVEDPTNPSYRAGLGNYILWQSGGRPKEQDVFYPSADFYYSADQAIVAPDWTWLAGENGWDELQRLAQAAGGNIYQDKDGAVRFAQPLNVANPAPSYHFTQSVYSDIQESASTEDLMTKAVVSFVPRAARAVQEIINDSTPRLVAPGATITVPLNPEWPLESLEYAPGSSTVLASTAIQATFLSDGAPVVQAGTGGYGHTVDFKAQQVTLVIGNTSARPFVVNRIILRGEPITAGEGATVTSGTGDVELTKEDNPYIQSRTHAQRLADIGVAIYGTARPIRNLQGCPFDPSRYIGEVVTLTCPELALSGTAHVIVAKSIDQGEESTYALLDISDVPRTSDYYVVSTTAQIGSKRLGF